MSNTPLSAPLYTVWENRIPNPSSPFSSPLNPLPSTTPTSSSCLIFYAPSPPSCPSVNFPSAGQKTPEGLGLTYFGTISARSAREASGTLEALSTRRATFTWETSFTLWKRETSGQNQAKVVETRQGAGGQVGVPKNPKQAAVLGDMDQTE